MRQSGGRNFLIDDDTESEKRTTARFMTRSGSTSSRDNDAFEDCYEPCPLQFRNGIDNLCYVFRRRMGSYFGMLYAAEQKKPSHKRSNRNCRPFSQLQLSCTTSIFEVVALGAQKIMVRAFCTVKQATGFGQFCELDVKRKLRMLASRNALCEAEANRQRTSKSPVGHKPKIGKNMYQDELALERAGTLLEAICKLQRERIRGCFRQLRNESESIMSVRAPRRFIRRRQDSQTNNRSTSRNNRSINRSAYEQRNEQPDPKTQNTLPRPNRITRNFQQYQTNKEDLSRTQLMIDTNRSTSRGRHILNKMESIISELNQEIRERSHSKSPLNSSRPSYRTSEQMFLPERPSERTRSPINGMKERIKLNIPIGGLTTSESAGSTFRSHNDNEDTDTNNSLLCKQDMTDPSFQAPTMRSAKYQQQPERGMAQDQNSRSKGFLRNNKLDRYKHINSSSFSNSNSMPNVKDSFNQYQQQPFPLGQESRINPSNVQSCNSYRIDTAQRPMNYQQQPVYQDFGHYYPPPMYPYYPPAMMPNGQYYYPQTPQQGIPYYVHPMHAMPVHGNMNMPFIPNNAMGVPPPVAAKPGAMPANMTSPQHPPMAYPYPMPVPYLSGHNSSTEDTTSTLHVRNRSSSALMGDINGSFCQQSFSGQDFAAGQCRYHKNCSCCP